MWPVIIEIWNWLNDMIQKRRQALRIYRLDSELGSAVQDLAVREARSPGEVVSGLVAEALAQRREAEEKLRLWEELLFRQQQVTALVCLGFTNEEIAERLGITTQTVKSNVQKVLKMYGLHRKDELRRFLADWDFNDWAGVGKSRE